MKRILLSLALIILLAPALMGATPTPNPEPTDGTIPEGWASIAETREIGGRQVALNERGDAATQIDGEWYPVDAKGCFYVDFFNPEKQKDPEIDVLIQKLNGEDSLVLGSKKEEFVRNNGVSIVGYGSSGGKPPSYWEKESDAILVDQKMCFNDQTSEWEHVLSYVLPRNAKTMSEETKVARAVVGWIRDGKYITFTHKQEVVPTGHYPDTSGKPTQKAKSVQEAFELWQQLIDDQEQVGVGMPLNVLINATGNMTEDEFQQAFPQLIDEIHDTNPAKWSDSVEDPEFKSWALSDKSLLKAWSKSTLLAQQTTVSNKKRRWRYMGEQTAAGKMPEPVIRTITEAEH